MNFSFSFSPTLSPKKRSDALYPLLIAIPGIVALIFSISSLTRTLTFLRVGVETNGTVVDVQEKVWRDSHNKTKRSFVSTIRFSTENGESHTVTTSGREPIGGQIRMIYDPADPASATVSSFFNLWGGPVLAALVGFLFIGIGVYVSVQVYRRAEMIEWLLRFGTKVDAVVIGINSRESRTKSGTRRSVSFNLIARGRLPGREETDFTSDQYTARNPPTDYVGSRVIVYMHPQNPDVHYVDLEGMESIRSSTPFI